VIVCACGACASEGRAREILRQRSGGACEVCDQARAVEMHHRRKPGRVWCPCNLLHLCSRCHHVRIEGDPAAAKIQGWWVEPGAAVPPPHLTPVWIARWGVVLLDAAGDYDLSPNHLDLKEDPAHAR